MTDRQLFRFFEIDRDEDGRPKQPAGLAHAPDYRGMFARHCFLGGVYDKATIARLWREEQAKQREAAE